MFTQIGSLPVLQAGTQTRQFSSYDRAGDNYDADYFQLYNEPNGESVIFDSYGPGCLYRLHMNIWNGDLGKNNIRFYFDDEKTPRIDMDVSLFFSDKNPLGIYREPLAHQSEGYRFVYHPFPYAKHLKIALERDPLGKQAPWGVLPWLGRYDQHPDRQNRWYQYTYHTYAQNPGLKSWTKPADMAPVEKLWATEKIGQPIQPEPPPKQVLVRRNIDPGKTSEMYAFKDQGSITGLRINFGKNEPSILFDTILEARFDGSEKPQVSVPLGAFFGIFRADPAKRIASRFVGTIGSQMYCYLPMPYWRGAVFSLRNQGTKPVSDLRIEFDNYFAERRLYEERSTGTFTAIYNRENPRREGFDYRYADVTGRGQMVGHFTFRKDTSMEEDERTYFDDSSSPSLYGDGFEDDHNQGWGLHDLQRAIYGSVASDGGAGAPWRFSIPDLYVFQGRLRTGHQVYGTHSPLGHEGMYVPGSEESVAFLYQQKQPGITITDEIDIGSPISEQSHRYKAIGDRTARTGKWWYDGEENNVLRPVPATVDNGNSVSKGSQFTLQIDPKNNGVRLRRRTDKENNRQLSRVYIDGKLVTEHPWYSVDFERTFRDIRWLDSDFEIPASYTRAKKTITVRIELISSENSVWDEYHYWAYCYR